MKQAVGIGGAKVEVRLNPGPVALGGFAKGRVVLKGGKGEQKCNGVEFALKRTTTRKVEREGKLVDQDDPYRVHQVNADRLLKRQQYEKAIEAIDQAMKGPNQGEWALSKLMAMRGQALEHLRRTNEAKLAYKKALDINGDNYEAKTRLKAL